MRRTAPFLVVAGTVVVALAVIVSPFASSAPDGLERVARDQGFADRAADHDLDRSPVAGYAVEGVDDDRLGTALSGLAGVVLTFGLGAGVFAVIRARGRRGTDDASADEREVAAATEAATSGAETRPVG